MCRVPVVRCVVKKKKDFQLSLREFWLPLTYYCLSFKFHIVKSSGCFQENRSQTHPLLFISICLYGYLLTNILCRREQKKQVDSCTTVTFGLRFVPTRTYPHTFIFPRVLWYYVCLSRQWYVVHRNTLRRGRFSLFRVKGHLDYLCASVKAVAFILPFCCGQPCVLSLESSVMEG